MTDKYRFIATCDQRGGIKAMSALLRIHRSGYYKWRDKGISAREAEDLRLLAHIVIIYLKYRRKYGSPRIFMALKHQGFAVSRKRVERLMRENSIISTYNTKKRKPRTTDSKHDEAISPNLLEQDFSASRPNTKWVSDITYIPYSNGWLYHCAIKDLCTKEIVGWSVADHMKTSLVVDALKYAVTMKNPQAELIFHSDRGSQYASIEFRSLLKSLQFQQSMSGKGNCYDNAPAESFFATLKGELIQDVKIKSLQEAEKVLFDYIEVFYNRQRIHSSVGYLTPAEWAKKVA